ncbi:hypothetical protein Salat_0258600 [Sesamum alatum]|uniref:Uncharacterized protein n=1 Tax=Sesamum alatum TaxID=300844 RepID=A0AAE1YZZ8_9LAMI|nr:hypothetical protein Salat_0258600 [Sesamum alatum]
MVLASMMLSAWVVRTRERERRSIVRTRGGAVDRRSLGRNGWVTAQNDLHKKGFEWWWSNGVGHYIFGGGLVDLYSKIKGLSGGLVSYDDEPLRKRPRLAYASGCISRLGGLMLSFTRGSLI